MISSDPVSFRPPKLTAAAESARKRPKRPNLDLVVLRRPEAPGAALAPGACLGPLDHKPMLGAAARPLGAEIRVFALGAGFGNSAALTTTTTTTTIRTSTPVLLAILAKHLE